MADDNTDSRPDFDAVEVSMVEGGAWIDLERWREQMWGVRPDMRRSPFAIKFNNGWIWDPIAGWRKDPTHG